MIPRVVTNRAALFSFKGKFPFSRTMGVTSASRGLCVQTGLNSAAKSSVESKQDTGAQQQALPKLPVPKLEDTLSKLLRTIKPFVTNDEFERTKKLAMEFSSGTGPKLQGLLEKRAQETDNWLSDWWLQHAYLENRSPVVVHSSPGLVLPLEDFKSRQEQLRYAAKLIYGALCFKHIIDSDALTPERMGKHPLDMSQYKKVFGTNRRPVKDRDELQYNPASKHIVVAYKNFFFKTPVYSESGDILSASQILDALNHIVNEASGLSGAAVGILTSDNRDAWATSYQALTKDKENAESVRVIEESLFVVSIDRPNRPLKSPKSGIQDVEDVNLSNKQTVAALQMLHGNRTNSGNRWFDKTINFIVGSEGECGLTYEHSPSEGPPIANMMDFVLNNFSKFEALLGNERTAPALKPEKLIFNTDKLGSEITASSDTLGALIDDVDMACFTFRKYGGDFIKSCQLSPDSYIQMAIQAAFYRIHQVPGAQYESATSRIFFKGRTETVRSCSIESLEFSRALLSTSLSAEEKFKELKRAVEAHKRYASEAIQGFGVDRHLLGLKLIASQHSIELPPFFQDPGVLRASHFRLSTSQVPSVNQSFMCYGPLVPDGYGCCYNPRKNDISFGISALNSSPITNAAEFKLALQQSLLEMHNAAVKGMKAKL